ncbi:MAG TPA: hypothetical protein VFQ85_11255 [Mycobacteriales bacterium]|nr:hypothetical protein [Mycobacteriales bacterium]
MRVFSKRSLAVVATATAVVTAGGIAYAYYLTDVAASGTGSAAAAANNSASITFAASSITGLVPGGTAKSTTVTFTNPNPYAVNYAGKTISVSAVSGPAGCADNTVALLSGSAPLGAGILAAGASTTVSVPVSMADSASVDQTSCAGATLTVTYAAS